jgi:hypothetical protein
MTREEKIAAITAKCADVNKETIPDIDNLKFGDRVKYKDYIGRVTHIVTGTLYDAVSIFIDKDDTHYNVTCRVKVSECEFLPRPITLADVLFLLSEVLEIHDWGASIDVFGTFYDEHGLGSKTNDEEIIIWDFSKPLHLQSSELINWLYSTIGGE